MGSTGIQISDSSKRLDVAIVGGGIAGITLALGLLSRNISVTVYERGQTFREIGAGIGFTSNAERAMVALDPRIHAAFKNVTVQNGTDWFNWMDGWRENPSQTGEDSMIHRMYLGGRGFEGCHRAEFLDELVRMIPEGVVRFGKNLVTMSQNQNGLDGVRLGFADGTFVLADTVIGCDGIRSKVRQIMFGNESPVSHPHYSKKFAFRGLIPMENARSLLGAAKTETRHMYLGLDGHVLTFPVAGGKLLNVVAFFSDPNHWPAGAAMTSPATKEETVKAFTGFTATVRSIIGLLPETLDKWAVFDTYDHPLPSFHQGRVILAGDSAHAAAPYHGAGAGFAIEDGAVLASLLRDAQERIEHDDANIGAAVLAVAESYDAIRRERAQWLVESSRFIGRMYQFQDEHIGSDVTMCAEEIEWRSREIWDYDVDDMLCRASSNFDKRMEQRRHCACGTCER